MVAVLVLTVRAVRTDRLRASTLVWGSWLVVTGLTFSLGQGIIHEYYTVALAPAIGALVGIGVVELWRRRTSPYAAGALALTSFATVLWSTVLLGRSADWMPWLRPTVLVVGLIATARRGPDLGASEAGGPGRGDRGRCDRPRRRHRLHASRRSRRPTPARSPPPGRPSPAAGASAPGAAAPPPVASREARLPRSPPGASCPAPDRRPDPDGPATAGPTGGPGGAGGAGGLLGSSEPSDELVAVLSADADSYTWIAATTGANSAAGYQLATGDPVMSLGGFNGSDPYPTLEQFQQYVADGEVHWYIAGGGMGGGGSDGRLVGHLRDPVVGRGHLHRHHGRRGHPLRPHPGRPDRPNPTPGPHCPPRGSRRQA